MLDFQPHKLIGKPVLVGGIGDRGVVASCSYEARKFGIHSAMPIHVAKRLCSHAIVVKGDYESYSKYSNLVTELIRDKVPMFEKSSIDEFYIDLTGMDRFFGCSEFSTEPIPPKSNPCSTNPSISALNYPNCPTGRFRGIQLRSFLDGKKWVQKQIIYKLIYRITIVGLKVRVQSGPLILPKTHDSRGFIILYKEQLHLY